MGHLILIVDVFKQGMKEFENFLQQRRIGKGMAREAGSEFMEKITKYLGFSPDDIPDIVAMGDWFIDSCECGGEGITEDEFDMIIEEIKGRAREHGIISEGD